MVFLSLQAIGPVGVSRNPDCIPYADALEGRAIHPDLDAHLDDKVMDDCRHEYPRVYHALPFGLIDDPGLERPNLLRVHPGEQWDARAEVAISNLVI